jgi:hypothetical protein
VKEFGEESLKVYGVELSTRFEYNNRQSNEGGLKFNKEIPHHERNTTLFRLACKLQGDGMDDELIRHNIHYINENYCKPPIGELPEDREDEVDGIVDSVISRYPKGERLWDFVQDAGFEGGDAETEGEFDNNESFLLMSWRDWSELDLSPPEFLINGLPRGNAGMLEARPNVGKSGAVINMSIALTTGRDYLNLVSGEEPKRVVIFDYETDAQTFANRIRTATSILSDEEKELVKDNLHYYVAKNYGVDYLDLSNPRYWKKFEGLILEFQPDVIFIDTVTAGFSIREENSNSEVTNKVMKPLEKLATKADCAILFTHHIGKAGSEEGSASNEIYRARGASSFAAKSTVVIL